MFSYFRKRRSEGRLPVPLRYLIMAFMLVLAAGFLWPDSVQTQVQPPAVQAEVSQSAGTSTPADAVIYAASTRTSGLVPETVLQNEKKDDSVRNGYFSPPVSRKISAILASFQPSAGLPVKAGGISLPEPRPQILQTAVSAGNDLQKRVAFLEKEGLRPYEFELKEGDTLADALATAVNISYDEVQRLTRSLAGVQDPKTIRPGQKIKVYTAQDVDGSNVLMALQMARDVQTDLTAVRVSKNNFMTGELVKPAHMSLKAARGNIENSLYMAASGQAVPDRIIVELIRAYSWSIDFQRDIRVNDHFEIMYEEYRTDDGQLIPGKGDIVYAALVIGGRPYAMYRYENEQGDADYFEADGQSVRKALMTTPINGARISSGFGVRHHPVLGYAKAHKGIDFAAPRGTPIYASGDGVIEYIGRRGSFGNYIKIRHRNNLHTAYAHMKGFKSGLKKGARVKQGDTIGYVGTTGRSTGPHLHYEVHVSGKQVNPKSVKLPTGTKLAGADLQKFKKRVADVNKQFAKFGLGAPIVAMNQANGKASTN